jgi:hypothetical protein
MTLKHTFTTNASFEAVSYDSDADSWNFLFANGISFNVSAFWRLLQGNEISLISLDNGHKFGYDTPINITDYTRELLNGHKLVKIEITEGTGDLILTLTNAIHIQVFISSTGYESYDFTLDNERYIGMGAGEIVIFSK